jgi:hypothetical protein
MSVSVQSVVTLLVEYPSIPLAIALFVVLLYTLYLHIKIRRFTRGNDGKSLETLIHKALTGIEEIEKRNELISKHALTLQDKVTHSLRNASMMRYKAFEQNGSSQSFSVAFLNEKGNGVVLSSLHARDRVSTFAKPIEKYVSSYDLTDEEKEVIKSAQLAHKA